MTDVTVEVVETAEKDIVVNIIRFSRVSVDARTSEVIIEVCLSPDILGNTEVFKDEQ